ncbi:MAG: hypothetical protein KF745_14265 [Phycisphaeraceae bacterium]|nr:hypothetical protein [Phycisphaeraceae bacterium]
MTAVLRASGPDFDVDAFVGDCKWNVASVFRRADTPPPTTRPQGRQRKESGLNVVVSNTDLDDFAGQLADAVEFLRASAEEVRRLVEFPGVSGVVLDFGIAWHDVAAQSDRFPAELIRLAGACGIALELSHYPVSDTE